MTVINIPGCKNCEGLRRDGDGSIWLTKPNKAIEAFLDRSMIRTRPRELRWREIPKGEQLVIQMDQLRGIHEGMTGLLLGKGPSLDRFITEYAKTRWHVIPVGINEAALRFPCKYVFALDDIPLRALTQARLDVTACLQPNHIEQPFTRKVIYEWGKHATPGHETAPVALECMAHMGIQTVVMVGFDGYDDGRDNYAPSLGISARRGDGNYAVVNRHLDAVAYVKKMRLVWWHRGGSSHHLEGQQRLAKHTMPPATTAATTSKPSGSPPATSAGVAGPVNRGA